MLSRALPALGIGELPPPKNRNIRKTLWFLELLILQIVDLHDLPFVLWCFSVLVLFT